MGTDETREDPVWRRLILAARRDERNLPALLERLRPILGGLARRLAWRFADDALQAAHVAIWRALPQVDADRTRGLRSMLVTTAINAMRDEGRRLAFQTRDIRLPGRGIAAALADRPAPDGPPVEFTGLLADYLDYVRTHGEFAGAHLHMARRLGLSISSATAAFHRAAREFAAAEGLAPARKRYEDVVRAVLGGDHSAEAGADLAPPNPPPPPAVPAERPATCRGSCR